MMRRWPLPPHPSMVWSGWSGGSTPPRGCGLWWGTGRSKEREQKREPREKEKRKREREKEAKSAPREKRQRNQQTHIENH